MRHLGKAGFGYNNLKNYSYNDGPKAICVLRFVVLDRAHRASGVGIGLFLVANAALFFERFYHYAAVDETSRLKEDVRISNDVVNFFSQFFFFFSRFN